MNKKRATILELLDFINKFSFERGLRWSIVNIYQNQISYDICWIHDKATENNWYMKQSDETEWVTYNPTDLINQMNLLKLDMIEFEIQLLKDICVQAVCSHYFIERASELIGKDKIDSSIELLKQFTAEKQQEQEAKTPNSTSSKKTKTKTSKLTLVKKTKKDE